jgi:hypothetical protein
MSSDSSGREESSDCAMRRAALENGHVVIAGTNLETYSDGLITAWDDVGA